MPRAAGRAWCLSLSWECEENGEKCIELRTEAAAARAGTRVFLMIRLRKDRAARTSEMEGVQSSCMFGNDVEAFLEVVI